MAFDCGVCSDCVWNICKRLGFFFFVKDKPNKRKETGQQSRIKTEKPKTKRVDKTKVETKDMKRKGN